MRFSLKHWLHFIGGVLCLFAVGFVLIRLNTYAKQIDFNRFNVTAWVMIGLLTLVYGASNCLLAQAWWHLLAFFDAKVKRGWAAKVYGLSQLAKYLPGNILHLAGRQALGMAAELPVRALVKSTLWELGLIAVAGPVFGFLALPLVWPGLPVFVSGVIFVATLVFCIIALGWLLSPSVAAAFIWQVIFLALSGTVFISILALITPSFVTFSTFSALCGAYVIAWLAGLVTPGAPAGVGVRELVLLFLIGGQVEQTNLLLAIVLGRLVTVGGDFFYFLTALFIKSRETGFESNFR
jgi:hypothetical protein